jgi:ribose 5-phosphate isomerase RpiB
MKKIGADGAARQLKGTLVEYLKEAGYEVEDYGSEAEGVDYPDVAVEVA